MLPVLYGKSGERLAVYRINYHYHHEVSVFRPQVLFYKSDLADITYEGNDIICEESLVVETNTYKRGFLRLRIPYPNKFQQCSIIEAERQIYLTEIPLDLVMK